jgi:hypothetical protein
LFLCQNKQKESTLSRLLIFTEAEVIYIFVEKLKNSKIINLILEDLSKLDIQEKKAPQDHLKKAYV